MNHTPNDTNPIDEFIDIMKGPPVMVENSVTDIKKDLYAAYENKQKHEKFMKFSSGLVFGSAVGAFVFPVPYLIAGVVAAGFALRQRHKLKSSEQSIEELSGQLEHAGGHDAWKTADGQKQIEIQKEIDRTDKKLMNEMGFIAPVALGAMAGGGLLLGGVAAAVGFYSFAANRSAAHSSWGMQVLNEKMGLGAEATPWDSLVSPEVAQEIHVTPLSADTLREKIQRRAQMAEQNIEGPAPLKPSM